MLKLSLLRKNEQAGPRAAPLSKSGICAPVCRPPGGGRGEGGFSFIELLAALTILAILATPLLSLFVSSYATMVLGGKQTVAANLSRAKIEEIKAAGFNSAYSYYLIGQNSPEIEQEPGGFPAFTRKTEVEFTTLPAESGSTEEPLQIELLLIRVTVSWDHRGQERSVEMESYLSRR